MQRPPDEFDSDVPVTINKLRSLPGVGPNMAFFFVLTCHLDTCVLLYSQSSGTMPAFMTI